MIYRQTIAEREKCFWMNATTGVESQRKSEEGEKKSQLKWLISDKKAWIIPRCVGATAERLIFKGIKGDMSLQPNKQGED